jgi:antitoxin (DNA-binding transcriptional repressor) of toxin-antitoxin stability system
MAEREKTVSVTEFKAKCLSLMDDVHARKLVRLKVEKRGKPHVVISAPEPRSAKKRSSFGSLKGWVVIPEGLDLTKPVFDDEIDAEKGILHR